MPKDFDEEEFEEFKYGEEKPLDDGQLLEVITPTPPPSIWSRIPVLIIIIVVALMVLWGIISKFLPTEKYASLSIISNPAGGLVYLDNEEKGLTPLYLPKIKAKEYSVKIIRSGFKEWDSIIKLQPKKTLEIKAELEDITPPEIISYPPSEVNLGKDLRIETTVKDNFQVGAVELFYRERNKDAYTRVKMIDSGNDLYWAVIPGSSVNRAGLEYYIKATDGINEVTYPENPLTPQVIRVSLGFGNLSISSSPSKAKVYINGKLQKMRTPIENMRLTAGKYKIKVAKEGYIPWRGSVLVKRKEKRRLSVILRKRLASIYIDSTVKGANVFINKKPYGKTPIKIKDLNPGSLYEVKVEHQGKIVYHASHTLRPGENKKIYLKLETSYGRAYITSIPPGAKVYMEEDFIGVTPLRNIKLPVGVHNLRAVKEEYPEKVKKIKIIENKISFLNFDLEVD
jgi:hypothetical protein